MPPISSGGDRGGRARARFGHPVQDRRDPGRDPDVRPVLTDRRSDAEPAADHGREPLPRHPRAHRDGVTVVAVVALVTRRVPPWARDVALPAATAIALVTTLGSLYYSEVAGYPPCTLCWYQRIAIYPQVVVLGVAALRRDRRCG
jgi:hypothetical protein